MMIIAYGLISRELYRGMQFELGQNTESSGEIQQKSNAKNTLFSLQWLAGIQIFYTSQNQGDALISPSLLIKSLL